MNADLLLYGSLALPCFGMLLLWIYSGLGARAAWVDVGWAGLIGLNACLLAFFGNGAIERRVLFGLLAALWSARLTLHLYQHRIVGTHRDGRYDQLKLDWGKDYRWKFLIFFQMQAVLVFLLTIPFYFYAFANTNLPNWAALCALVVFILALIGEAVADRQLGRFKSDPGNQGKVCQSGLWNYSRHPNYFFEWLIWCSYIFLGVGTGYSWQSALISLFMYFLVTRVTGVPPTEAQALRSRGQAYKDYQATTSVLIPWFKKEIR